MQKGSLCECTTGGDWISKAERTHPGPGYKQIVTCSGYGEGGPDYLVFDEYQGHDEDGERYSFHRMYFREIQPPMAINIESIISEAQTA